MSSARKLTFKEFDSKFNEWEKWPIDLSYKVYEEILDYVDQLMEERNEVVHIDSSYNVAK